MTDTHDEERAVIPGKVIDWAGPCWPFNGVTELAGVRVYHVGQGDGIGVLDSARRPVFQIDYGGRQSNPFTGLSPAQVDGMMPLSTARMVMVTHWDQDHWCTALKADRIKQAHWLVPRQVTSPSAVQFATGLANIACIPEALVGVAHCFKAGPRHELWWEKIGRSKTQATEHEDCNKTGVAFAVVQRDADGGGQAILLPGDAPFGNVDHYNVLRAQGLMLRGIVAFHHGAKTHWNERTRRLLAEWPSTASVDVVYSCGDPNGYKHPFPKNYDALLQGRIFARETPSSGNVDILFVQPAQR